ncbi:MAG: hypothetical protein M3Z24_07435, partial [Chloroflexota bacterium]|nr:hypothetical protein [Chloroflexota bacterium]
MILPSWFNTIVYIYYLLALTGILITVVVSYRQSSPVRGRQQLRFFVGGVIVTVVPFLLLTALPLTLKWPYIDPQLSTLTIGFFPLALGYTILRYQVLVFDKYIRKAVVLMVRCISLAIVGYLIFTIASITLSNNAVARDIVIIVAMVVLVPLVLWGAKVVTDHLFFKEMLHYRQLIEKADTFEEETIDLDEAARLLTLAAINVFETQEICLFVLDNNSGCYCISPVLKEDEQDAQRFRFAEQLLQNMKQGSDEQVEGIEAKAVSMRRLVSAKRPLFLREVTAPGSELPTGLAQYLTIPNSSDGGEEHTEPLLAPIRVQGKMIAVLGLGERGDHQQYAGPDFEILEFIFTQYSSVLETSRLMVELRAAYERQKELDKLKDRFIMTASHELRTPLTAVQGYIELLKEYYS